MSEFLFYSLSFNGHRRNTYHANSVGEFAHQP
jgi:hypothetical protein